MKIFHLSDLHIGKQISGYDIEEDQRYVFQQILKYIKTEKPDVVIIAGDIYDRAIPSAKAVGLFDELLWEISRRDTTVIVISGNHDSAERMAYGSRIMKNARVHIAGAYKGSIDSVVLEDEYGPVNFYLMPFVRPLDVREYFPIEEDETADYGWAVDRLIESMNIDTTERNVLVAHQNVTNKGENSRTESETVTIGMIDNIDVSHFEAFDYVALGHLHRPQYVGRPEVRYCGTPMAYSISEYEDDEEDKSNKSISVVNIMEKSNVSIDLLPLKQLRGWLDFKGTIEEAMEAEKNDCYTRFMLTNDETVIDAVPRLRTKYDRILEVSFMLQAEADGGLGEHSIADIENKTPLELFQEFYSIKHNGTYMSENKKKYIEAVIREVEEKE